MEILMLYDAGPTYAKNESVLKGMAPEGLQVSQHMSMIGKDKQYGSFADAIQSGCIKGCLFNPETRGYQDAIEELALRNMEGIPIPVVGVIGTEFHQQVLKELDLEAHLIPTANHYLQNAPQERVREVLHALGNGSK